MFLHGKYLKFCSYYFLAQFGMIKMLTWTTFQILGSYCNGIYLYILDVLCATKGVRDCPEVAIALYSFRKTSPWSIHSKMHFFQLTWKSPLHYNFINVVMALFLHTCNVSGYIFWILWGVINNFFIFRINLETHFANNYLGHTLVCWHPRISYWYSLAAKIIYSLGFCFSLLAWTKLIFHSYPSLYYLLQVVSFVCTFFLLWYYFIIYTF